MSLAHLEELFRRKPEFFDGPFDPKDFSLNKAFTLEDWPNAVLQGEQLYFLITNDTVMRQDPVLLQTLDTQGSGALAGAYCSALTAVEVPDDVAWHIFEYEDGSEAVHENHRVWS